MGFWATICPWSNSSRTFLFSDMCYRNFCSTKIIWKFGANFFFFLSFLVSINRKRHERFFSRLSHFLFKHLLSLQFVSILKSKGDNFYLIFILFAGHFLLNDLSTLRICNGRFLWYILNARRKKKCHVLYIYCRLLFSLTKKKKLKKK